MRHRLVARSLQSPPAAQQPPISTPASGNEQDVSLADRLRCAPPPAHAGIGGDLQLTMQPDLSSRQSSGASGWIGGSFGGSPGTAAGPVAVRW